MEDDGWGLKPRKKVIPVTPDAKFEAMTERQKTIAYLAATLASGQGGSWYNGKAEDLCDMSERLIEEAQKR